MPKVSKSITINCKQSQAYAVAQDYSVRLEWDAFTRHISFNDGNSKAAEGVRVIGRSWHGMLMEVEFVKVDAPRRAAMKMIEGPFFFGNFAGTWRFIALPGKRTLVKFHYHFKSRWPWLRFVIDPIIRFVLKRDVNTRLCGLKTAIETTDIYTRTDDYQTKI